MLSSLQSSFSRRNPFPGKKGGQGTPFPGAGAPRRPPGRPPRAVGLLVWREAARTPPTPRTSGEIPVVLTPQCTPVTGARKAGWGYPAKQKGCRQRGFCLTAGREETGAFPERIKTPGSRRAVSIPPTRHPPSPVLLMGCRERCPASPGRRDSALGTGGVSEAGQRGAAPSPLPRAVPGGNRTCYHIPACPPTWSSQSGTITRFPPGMCLTDPNARLVPRLLYLFNMKYIRVCVHPHREAGNLSSASLSSRRTADEPHRGA